MLIMKHKGCPCGSKITRCWVENGFGIIACRDCGLILNDNAVCGSLDLDKHTPRTREQRHNYSLKGGYVTARQKQMNMV